MAHELTNPALADLEFLVGDWDMALSGAAFLPTPDTVVHGRVEIRPIENGGLLAMRQVIEPSGPPAATWVIGRDEARSDYTVLYADERGVSRRYEMAFVGETWRIWRNDPHFSQRFDAAIGAERHRIVGRWQKRSAGGGWEPDFDLTYTRL